MGLGNIFCISHHSQSPVFVSKQAEGCNLSSKRLQSTLLIYLFTYVLTYLILNLKMNAMNWSKKHWRGRGREGKQWAWQHWEGYSISHLPVTVQIKITPSAVHLRNGVKGGKICFALLVSLFVLNRSKYIESFCWYWSVPRQRFVKHIDELTNQHSLVQHTFSHWCDLGEVPWLQHAHSGALSRHAEMLSHHNFIYLYPGLSV